MKILGIDPGSRLLGYGLVSKSGSRLTAHGYGTLKFNTKVEANERLLEIYRGVRQLLAKYQPDHVAIEKVFFAKNVVSALKLGQARGVAMLAVVEAGLPLFEYNPNEIKRATVGFGHADKDQVARMVARLLGFAKDAQAFDTTDASDALAIAICHLNTYSYTSHIQKALDDV